MKPYLIGLLILTAATANLRATTNTIEKTGGHPNPDPPIMVKTGRIFTIRMESNPTTGYGWQLSDTLDTKIILITNTFIPPDGKLCGAGGLEVWTFKAIGAGQAQISLKYVRPWEKDQPARTNVFAVIVN